MSIELAQAIWLCVGAYFGVGLLFGLYFVFRRVDRMDAAAKGAGLPFRLLILPGTAALWPILFATSIFAPAAKGSHE